MPWINSQDSRIFKGRNCNYILHVYTICILLRTWDSSEKFRWPIKWCLYLSHSQMHYNLLKIWLIHVLLCNAVSIACIIAWHNAMHTILMRPINCLLIGLDGLRLFPVLRREHLIKLIIKKLVQIIWPTSQVFTWYLITHSQKLLFHVCASFFTLFLTFIKQELVYSETLPS